MRGRSFNLDADEILLGRSDDSGIDLSSYQQVSRHHVRIYTEDWSVVIEDLGSTNGVYLNGHRIAVPTRLSNGTQLKMGDFVARAVLSGGGSELEASSNLAPASPHPYLHAPLPDAQSPAYQQPQYNPGPHNQHPYQNQSPWHSPPPPNVAPTLAQQGYQQADYSQQGFPMQGYPHQHPPPPVFYKNPSIAVILSFFYTGLGQMYNGEIGKGVLFLLFVTIAWIFAALTCGVGLIIALPLWIWGLVDAYQSAERINRELSAAGQYQQLP